MMDVLQVEDVGGGRILTMNRPRARNAVTLELAQAMADAFAELDADERLAVGVIAGAGGTFCAGMDLKGFARGEIPIIPGRGFAGLVERPPEKPLVAAAEGYALGGGFEVALACDLVVASSTAVFGLPEVTRGLTAAGGDLFRLPRRVPYHIAMELILTGRQLTAGEAARLGLVNRLADDGAARATAMELARTVAANAPLAVRTSKRVVVESATWAAADAFALQWPYVDRVRKSGDAREGARAFAEKRQPRWGAAGQESSAGRPGGEIGVEGCAR